MVKVQENKRHVVSCEVVFSTDRAKEAIRFHRSLPDYFETELVELKGLAGTLGVRGIFAKDESTRFGIKAFKGLGGSYAMFRILCQKLKLDPATMDFSGFEQKELRDACKKIEFVTATDGNHGRGVSWAASLFGCKAHVYLPAGSSEARRKAIEEQGNAEAVITDMNYDRTVEYASKMAEENGWILIQDTAWDGYEQIPSWIVEGYLTMALEAANGLGDAVPTHVFLQAGVGAMAGGVMDCLLDIYKENPPVIVLVEPEAAACVYSSAEANDGKAHSLEGDLITIMAGLNCGTPCSITWPVMRDKASFFCACDDIVAEEGMRLYARPADGDKPVVSGESGAVTLGLVHRILKDESMRTTFNIGNDAVILLFNTEGDTNPELYKSIVDSKNGI